MIVMNLYESIIAEELNLDEDKAKEIFSFMCIYFDDFRFSSATRFEIAKQAFNAFKMMEKYRELLKGKN